MTAWHAPEYRVAQGLVVVLVLSMLLSTLWIGQRLSYNHAQFLDALIQAYSDQAQGYQVLNGYLRQIVDNQDRLGKGYGAAIEQLLANQHEMLQHYAAIGARLDRLDADHGRARAKSQAPAP